MSILVGLSSSSGATSRDIRGQMSILIRLACSLRAASRVVVGGEMVVFVAAGAGLAMDI